jgi:hypothetical protein
MSEQINSKIERNSIPRKVTVQDKMDTRDCARLLDYYRMRVGNKLCLKIILFLIIII